MMQSHTLLGRLTCPALFSDRQRCHVYVPTRVLKSAAGGLTSSSRGRPLRVAEAPVRELEGEVFVPHEPAQVMFAGDGGKAGEAAPEVRTAGETESFDWHAHWYPAGLIDNLRTDVPNSAVVLGREMVVWRDGNENWCAALDECPHRFAKLSDGKLGEGRLECRYHGWQFDDKGKCVSNPQADGPKAESLVTTSSRSCLQSYPTRVEQGLLWVWPQANAWLESLKEQPPLFEEGPGWLGDKNYGFGSNPVSYAVMVENAFDPDHAPFLHDGLVCKKEEAAPIHMRMDGEISTNGGFTIMHDGYTRRQQKDGMKATRTFIPPCTVRTDYIFDDGRGQRATLYFVPESPYNTRVYGNFTFKGPAKKGGGSPRPPPKIFDRILRKIAGSGLGHARGHGLVDQDNLILAGVGEALARKARGWRDYYLPTSADVGVTAFHRWLTEKAGGHPAFKGGATMADAPRLSRADVWNRYERHTKHCRQCQESVKSIDHWTRGLAAASIGFGGLAIVLSSTMNIFARASPVAVALACLLLREALLRVRQDFFTTDHLPGEKPLGQPRPELLTHALVLKQEAYHRSLLDEKRTREMGERTKEGKGDRQSETCTPAHRGRK